MFVRKKGRDAQNGEDRWGVDPADSDDRERERRLGPYPTRAFGGAFEPYGSGGEHHRVYGREVIHLAAKENHFHEEEEVSQPESAKDASSFREEEKKREDDEDCGDIAEHLGLRFEIRKQWKRDIAATSANVSHQLEKWKLVPPLPPEVGQGDGCRDGAADPKPAMGAGIGEAASGGCRRPVPRARRRWRTYSGS